MTDLSASPLGHPSAYGGVYDPSLLFPVDRAPLRERIGIAGALPFFGHDVWNAYELSWLDTRGKPSIAIATFVVPASSPCIVESKSMKLYATAFNQTRFASAGEVRDTIARDLSAATRSDVAVELVGPEAFASLSLAEPRGVCLDDLPVAVDEYQYDANLLLATSAVGRERFYTRLFRSLCPVTGQPDYGTVMISQCGVTLDRCALLRYLVSFRNEPGFHEHCVETIFIDLLRRFAPDELHVEARFTRRGGIDINPYRSTHEGARATNLRTARQ
ncbi:MAG: NADPH-dependent 7-cyano-7-deazaguanine reductase QueF [Pseudomonadota bacterium]|nr:NADPH-dependent 7-cyano-7-deazaguanine reductase QueF [Pseudomonadota bacterium]